ncbi:unnamed protein product [Parascedosporium putredinis]|uniref:Carrier domain-containing protein n=1 Tax=Parascedosporium putredinis TaxID=1442378 RepID=A0A9P1GZW4_9PEZI|nr:unnamed protein product [Parascedosporium putredinis]CAI7992244.1 unnamed protein product [Parascedosporium putredinis]
MSSSPVLPDPTVDLGWDDFRGAIHDIFAANAEAHPDRHCVVETKGPRNPERIFTYKQINESSNKLAHYFLDHGCERGDVVMIYAHRSVDLVVAYMGALKAGATVANPVFLVHIQRATQEAGKLADTVAEFITNNLKIKAEVPALALQDNGELEGGDVNGQDCFAAQEARKTQFPGVQRFGLSENDRFTMLSGIAHDPIQRDIFTPLFLGAQIVVPPQDMIAHELLAEWMRENKVNVTHLTPAMGQILVGGASAQIPTLHHAFFVGDILTKKDCRKLQDLAQNVFITNLWGTTETQRSVSFYEIPSKAKDPEALDNLPDIIPVGQGMNNVQLLVLDRDNKSRMCDVGEQGELFIRAGGLATGYLGDDETIRSLNESKFLMNWFVDNDVWQKKYEEKVAANGKQPWMEFYKGPRDRIYRSGDLGRVRPDGNVECTGRVDNQVKIRGFRIELGEIDTHLSRHPFIRENVTVVRRDENEEPKLVSYIVPEAKRWFQHLQESGKPVNEAEDDSMIGMFKKFRSLSDDCKSFLKTKVPQYAVPTMFIPLTRMPLNPNGKIDKPALPFPSKETDLALLARRPSQGYHSMTETQKRVAAIWASVIPNRTARMFVPESNFFEEGGHSILAQQMLFNIRKEWKDIDVPMSVIFQSQTLGEFATEIDRALDPTGLRLDVPRALASGSNTVFLTGATGFLGSYILRELLSQPETRVIAHARGKDAASAVARIETISKAYGNWSEDWRSRIEAVTGDISKQNLGLSKADWDRVAAEADVIIHNGAQVNWMLPYSSLRSANVLSTVECITLANTGKPKSLAFVSSTSTLDSDYYVELSKKSAAEGGTGVQEDDDLEGSRKGLGTGYGQSKWASEYIVREAGRRGLVGAVVRPGYVTGDPVSGTSITDDFLVRLWKGCLQVGARPDITNTVNQVPVTQVARIVTAAALYPPTSPLGVVQVTSHPRLTMNEWLGVLEVHGYPVPQIPYPEWSAKLRDYVSDPEKEEHALLPLFHFVAGDLPANSIAPELNDSNAGVALRNAAAAAGKAEEGDPLAAGAVTLDVAGRYLAYLVATGFLPSPPADGKAERQLPSLEIGEEKLTALAALGGRAAGK